MGFFRKIGGFFKKVGHAIGKPFKSAGKTISHVVGGVYKDVKSGLTTVANFGTHVVDEAGKTVRSLGKTAGTTLSNVSSSLSTPLLIAGGVVAIFLLQNKNIL